MAKEPTTIKKYANRRLYNTGTSTYVTLEDLAEMVKSGEDFTVFDAKTGEDITRSVLTQIIFEQENKGQNLLPITFLRQLIRFYGDSIQNLIPTYLDFSIDSLVREQEKLRGQMTNSTESTKRPRSRAISHGYSAEAFCTREPDPPKQPHSIWSPRAHAEAIPTMKAS